MNVVHPEAAPFFYKRGEVGCLLIHGYTGAPAEMRWLGKQLAGLNYSVLGPRLFAHGTDQEDLIRARWHDWYHSVEDGYHLLKGQCDQIFVVGLSLGGVLALTLGGYKPVSGIVALSTPFSIPDAYVKLLLPLIPIISKVWRFKTKGVPHWVEPGLQEDHYDYPAFPLIAASHLHNLLKEMQKQLPNISAPVLILHSKTDRSVSESHPQNIFKHVGSSDKALKWVENSSHVVTRDAEKDLVLEEIHTFIQRIITQSDS